MGSSSCQSDRPRILRSMSSQVPAPVSEMARPPINSIPHPGDGQAMDIRFISHIDHCPADDWDAIAGADYPFTRHCYLAALERSGSVGGDSGWLAHHALLYEDNTVVGVMPLYIKQNSYGEYVFDWSWANAYHQNGLEYYPKLVTAIPFTPATGPRLMLTAGAPANCQAEVRRAVEQEMVRLGASGWHLLFPAEEEAQQWQRAGLMQRRGVQYHWFNEDYRDFDDFLAGFSSRKRKNLRKERRRVADQGISLHCFQGEQLTGEHWQHFFAFYQMTYARLSGHGGYLRRAFFEQIGNTMGDAVVMVLAKQEGRWIAGALNFLGHDTLYGRYWGCARECEFLHFETCYYQGIEYCIRHGIKRFDPGAQGEHKIQRGFTPVATSSSHLITHPGFRQAIGRFLDEEASHMEHYTAQASAGLPFKKKDQ